MKIKHLTAEKLHGSLNLNISFHERLNLLVGINGCGKTSALNIVEWLFEKNFSRLCVLRFEKLTVRFEFEASEYLIFVTKTDQGLELGLTRNNEYAYVPIKVRRSFYAHLDEGDPNAARELRHLGPEEHEQELWRFLDALPKLSIINLDRTISAEIGTKSISDTNHMLSWEHHSSNQISAIEHVKKVTRNAFSKYRKQAIEIDAELKSKIVMSSLQSPAVELSHFRQQDRLSERDVQELESIVVTYLSRTFPNSEVELNTRKFFEYISSLSNSEISAELSTLVQAQYARVRNLAVAFNDYETRTNAAFSQIQNFLDLTNAFFEDSNKSLYFEPGSGNLYFNYNSQKTAQRDLSTLSSGERQILFLLALAAFESESPKVVIVDEPELSLHPKWQHDFLDAFLRLCPGDLQLILATHSPEIVGRHKEFCIPLLPAEFHSEPTAQ